MMSNITGRLIDAERIRLGRHTVIRGAIYGDVHERWHDGEIIYTSPIVNEDGSIITTRNSIYEIESWKGDL